MKNIYRIREILDEIETLEAEISAGEKAWSNGDNECAMADCDPSDQFCKGEEIVELQKELKELVAEI